MVIVINQAALEQVMRESPEIQDAMRAAGERIADFVRGQGVMIEHIPGDEPVPVEVELGEVDGKPAILVTLAHPAGLAVQAKHGPLTAGAAAAGLEVTG